MSSSSCLSHAHFCHVHASVVSFPAAYSLGMRLALALCLGGICIRMYPLLDLYIPYWIFISCVGFVKSHAGFINVTTFSSFETNGAPYMFKSIGYHAVTGDESTSTHFTASGFTREFQYWSICTIVNCAHPLHQSCHRMIVLRLTTHSSFSYLQCPPSFPLPPHCPPLCGPPSSSSSLPRLHCCHSLIATECANHVM